MQTYEVELRALLSTKEYNRLLEYFNSVSKYEIDDAETFTFLSKDYNIKVKNLISKNKAKITAKKGAEYKQLSDEKELYINPRNVQDAVALITLLGFEKHIPSYQKRLNYCIDEITVSLKHETHWGYHMEAEIVVQTEKEIPTAREKILKFFENLNIVPMTEQENRALVNSVLKKYDMNLI